MPPMQQRLLVEVSGLKNSPYGLSAMFSSSLTTPGCTLAHRSSALISSILFQCLLMSATIPLPTTCPAIDVPPALGIRSMPFSRASAISLRTSSTVSGQATPYGISRYTEASVA